MQLDELKDNSKKEATVPHYMAMTVMGPNPLGWRPCFRPFNVHHVIDKVISPISNEYQERILKDIMEDSKGG